MVGGSCVVIRIVVYRKLGLGHSTLPRDVSEGNNLQQKHPEKINSNAETLEMRNYIAEFN